MTHNSEHLLIRAAKNQAVERTPIWIMRQAGRYLPEYKELRRKVEFFELCKTPELAVEASLMPLKRFNLDAAIIFSDILIPVEAMGCSVALSDRGPVIKNPVRTTKDVQELRIPHPQETMPYTLKALSLLNKEVGRTTPVIGFAGAPFTLAAYMVEGKPASAFGKLRELMYGDPQTYHELSCKLADTVGQYLKAQVEAGAHIVQLFDTWAGLLSENEYVKFALPYEKRALSHVQDIGTPTVLFINGCQHIFHRMPETGASVLGIDWRTSLFRVASTVGKRCVLQGNLNPALLFAGDAQTLEKEVDRILDIFTDTADNNQIRGHIFNLGHGIHPTTPIENVQRLVDRVQSRGV